MLSCLVGRLTPALGWLTYQLTTSTTTAPSQGFILVNQVTHARTLPNPSRHAFAYPVLFILVSLRALESNSLDCGRGRVFGYGGLYGRLTGVRPSGYLIEDNNRAISDKLQSLLERRGLDGTAMTDVWMLTMPSYLGFEGINPLTVYFLYTFGDRPWVVVLEVHNTFGERHAYVLRVDEAEERADNNGFTHRWTFPRQFHVSPFNDRLGYYTVSVKIPPAPTTLEFQRDYELKPNIRVQLFTSIPTDDSRSIGSLKLSAVLRTSSSRPLTTRNLLVSLFTQPFVLLLSMSRILYQAWILHYKKGLNVYVRPDPHPVASEWGDGQHEMGGGVGWQPEIWLEAHAKVRMRDFIQRRSDATGISVVLVSANPSTSPIHFRPTFGSVTHILKVSYTSSAFFSALYTSPSFAHAMLLFRSERLVHLSSEGLAREFFVDPSPCDRREKHSLAQRLRMRRIPPHLADRGPGIPANHPLNHGSYDIIGLLVLLYGSLLEWIGEMAYRATRTRFVAGQEPWKKWERALEGYNGRDEGTGL